ncbi:tyrosine-protein phosphatase 10D-like [Polistes fuscatus]|uniref:tyrosine-protein phosphatase 10D-like n=1 Tax=Polistes fuscatus TaxID=30207 RepID=UPI001CA8650E|nr:tyrosine-protein phosphatase 10D-like [Polistes fuscatus]
MKEMISRKHLQLLLYILRILYAFGEEDTNERNENSEITSNIIQKYSSFDKDKSLSKTGGDINTPTKSFIPEYVKKYKELYSSPEFNNDHIYLCAKSNAIDRIGESINTSGSLFTCLEIEDVQELKVIVVDTESISISWIGPCPAVKNILLNYTIVTYNDQIKKSKNITNQSYYITYNVTDLIPCTSYTFEVFVVARDIKSNGVNITHKTSSNLTYIENVQNLFISELDNTEINDENKTGVELTWDTPNKYINCINYYKVIKCIENNCDENNKEVNITHITKYIEQNLDPCTKYTYTIKIVTNSTESAGETKSHITRTITPGETQSLIAEPDDFALKIHWLPPIIGRRCVQTYRVIIFNMESNFYKISYTTNTSIVIKDLHACTSYMIHVIAFGKDSSSGMLATTEGRTNKNITQSPVLFAYESGISNISMTWSIRNVANNCELESLIVTCNYVKTNGHGYVPKSGNVQTSLNNHTILANITVTDLSPYTTYLCEAFVVNEAGNSSLSEPKNITTLEDILPPPTINVINVTDTQFIFILEKPTYLPGVLIEYEIKFTWNKLSERPESCTDNISGTVIIRNITATSFEYSKGKPYTNYTATAKAKTAAGWSNDSNVITFVTEPGIPLEPNEEYIKSITIDAYKARRSTTSVTILLPLFSDDNGEIKYYAIMVSRKGYNVASKIKFNLTQNGWPNVSSWEESMKNDFSISYQATRPRWQPFPSYIADYGHIKAVKYVLGEDTACKEISSNTNGRLYCNGPLKSDTWYDVRMRAFTSGGFTDSPTFLIKTNAELDVGAVIGIVFGILLLGILTTTMLLVRKCSPYTIFRQFLNADMPGSPIPTPFTRKKFLAHCQELVDNPGKLSNEFRLLQTLSVDLQMPTNTACLQANRKKNRYSDILPYDFSRVKLEVIDNDPNTDYINASFIKGYSGEDEYIACQGPKEDTTYDFWRMIDQYEINIIVMLTQLVEKDKVKCHQYYPTIRETFGYENITIRCTSELDFRTYTQRTLILQKENKKKTITHFHFKEWPDHDVPEDFDSMINFCQILRRNIGTNKGFVVVHCSAGIGRTGTLIAIDILLQYLRDNRKLDVFGTVYRLRHHRINMVQRESQYTYIYNCLMQVLKNPYFLKSYKPPPVDPVHDNNSKSASETMNSDGSHKVNLETCM